MNLLQRFEKKIGGSGLPVQKLQLLLAVSGGMDSAVLCELCKQAGFNFTIAHCNFGLRGEESDRDELFVRNLGAKYGVDVFVKKFDTGAYVAEHKMSIQEAARDLRYEWFAQLQKEKGFACTLLAHHADDNIETLLMNFFRGTGLQGMTGMPESDRQKRLLRPLLGFRRSELEVFARENNLQWVEDSSNASTKYTRNFFRHELLPAVKNVYPGVEENLLDHMERFKKINALYRSSVEKLKQEVCEPGLAEVRIPVKKLMKYADTPLIYEVIKDYGFGEKQVGEVVKLTEAGSGKFIENERYQIIKHRNWLIIAAKTTMADAIAIGEDRKEIRFGGGVLKLGLIPIEKFSLDQSAGTAQLDSKHIEFPLLLRRWRQGDYFYPLGMPKKKKLARFFIDQKLSKNQKENVWVVESDKKIIWVVGMRIDDRFKVKSSTKDVLQITISIP